MPLNNVKNLCGATTKKKTKCPNPAMLNGRCRKHGGKSPLGIASPHFKDGRFSKAFPAQIAAKIKFAAEDDQLTEMREELAMIDVLLSERVAQAYNGETAPAWAQIKTNYKFYREALDYLGSERAGKDLKPKFTEAQAAAALDRMGELITYGIKTYEVFELVQPMLEQRRRIVETEIKRLKDLGQMIPAEQAFAFVYRIVSIIKKYITNPSHLQAISREIAGAVNEKEKN